MHLERSSRVSMVLRASVTISESASERLLKRSSGTVVKHHNLWKVDAEIAKKGQVLEAGEHRENFRYCQLCQLKFDLQFVQAVSWYQERVSKSLSATSMSYFPVENRSLCGKMSACNFYEANESER